MAIDRKKRALLVDLDGVLVLERARPGIRAPELFLLCPDIRESLNRFDSPIVVITHRSRKEARKILGVLGLTKAPITLVLAAEDLFWAGIRKNGGLGLLFQGHRKSLALQIVRQELGVLPCDAAMIDDRPENLKDLLAGGLGLAVLAPCEIDETNGTMITFQHEEFIRLFLQWEKGEAIKGGSVQLQPVKKHLCEMISSGLNTKREGLHAFNLARLAVRTFREAVKKAF